MTCTQSSGDNISLTTSQGSVSAGSSSVDRASTEADGHLVHKLLIQDVDVEGLARTWLSTTQDDWNNRKRDIVELVFHSIGWFSFNFQHLLSGELQLYISRKRLNQRTPLAVDEPFVEKYEKFMECLFYFHDFASEESGIEFMCSLAQATCQLMSGAYDSYRFIAACTGLKLLTSCFISLKNVDEEISRLDSSEREDNKTRLISLRTTLTSGIFQKAIRDVDSDVRRIVFREMRLWANINSEYLIANHMHRYIVFGIHDPACYRDVLVLANELFKDEIDATKQHQLLKSILKPLIHHLVGSSGKSSQVALDILSSAARYLDVVIPTFDLEIVYMFVYNPDRIVATNAAKFLFNSRLKEFTHHPELLLRDLVVFNSEAKISSEELVVDSFFSIIKEYVYWEHWKKLFILCPPELTVSCVKLFINYVKRAVTNYHPPGRNKTIDRFQKKDLELAANSFTSYFSVNWLSILDIDRIRLKPEALGLVIRSMKFFNQSISSSNALHIIASLSRLLKSDDDPLLLDSCWSTLTYLKKLVPWDYAAILQLDSIWDSVKQHIVQEFLDSITFPSSSQSPAIGLRMNGLVRWGEIHDSDVWDFCCAALRSLLRCYTRSSPVIAIMKVLQDVVFDHYRLMDASSKEKDNGYSEQSESNINSSLNDTVDNYYLLSSRSRILQNYAVELMDVNYDLPVRLLAFNVLVDSVKCFGKHMSGHPVFSIISDNIHPSVDTVLVDFACEMMNREECEAGFDDLHDVCCEVLNKISRLFSVGYIDILKLGQLMGHTGRIAAHNAFVISALKSYAANFPSKGKTIAIVIFRGIAGVIDKAFLDEPSLRDNEDWDSVLVHVKRALQRWQANDDFLKVLRIANVAVTTKMMLDLVSRELGIAILREFSRSELTLQPVSTYSEPTNLLSRVESYVDPSVPTDMNVDEEESVINYTQFGERPPALQSTMFEPQSESS